MIRVLLLSAILLAFAAPAWPCSVIGPLPPASVLVDRAEVIARVRAEGLSDIPGRPGTMAGSKTQVWFTVREVLKGRLPSSTIEFNGTLDDRDDQNGRPVPYDHVRPSGSGSCFALTYRIGSEYLLFLRRGEHPSFAQPDDLTPYWAALGPTNEQLFGGTADPWLVWVSRQLRTR